MNMILYVVSFRMSLRDEVKHLLEMMGMTESCFKGNLPRFTGYINAMTRSSDRNDRLHALKFLSKVIQALQAIQGQEQSQRAFTSRLEDSLFLSYLPPYPLFLPLMAPEKRPPPKLPLP